MTRKRRLVPFAITALVLVTAAVPAAYVAAPYVERCVRLSQLDHPDDAVRQRATGYAVSHLTDPTHGEAAQHAVYGAMLDAARKQSLDGDRAFERLRQAVESVGQWRVDRIPSRVWLVWLSKMTQSPIPEARVRAIWMIVDLPNGEPYDEAKGAPLIAMCFDSDPAVQINAAAAVGELAGVEGDVGELARRWLIDIAVNEEQARPGSLADDVARRLLDARAASASSLRPAASVVLPDAPEGELLAGLSSDAPGLQALALTCLRAGVTPIEEAEQGELAGALLRSFDPVERRAGALLAGATGTHADLLTERLASTDDFTEASMLRLGLWLQGGGEAGWDPALLLVTPQVLPMPLVRWGLVVPTLMAEPAQRTAERRRVAAVALDDWLVPRGDLPHGLVEELFHKHGWQAMAPLTAWVGPVPADADADVQELMAERLRDHWLVTRRRFLGDSDTTEASR
ncbi:MAG: hypothetical protein AAFY08_08815 [Planctomycetota bacterium]